MSFKEMVGADLCSVFFNLEEFGETHIIEGNEVDIVIDNDELKRRQSGEEYAVAESATLFFCRSTDLPKKKPGQTLKVDGRVYNIDDWKEDMGMSTVVLRENLVT